VENHSKYRSLNNIVKYVYEDRRKKFEQFIEYCRVDLSNSKDNLFVNIMNINWYKWNTIICNPAG